MRCKWLLMLALAPLQGLRAEQAVTASGDSLTPSVRQPWTQTPLFQKTVISVPLIATGILVKGEDKKWGTLRNEVAPHFHLQADNYLPYLPLALQYGLKAAGVQSRSSWNRMLVSDALSAALMVASTQSLKHVVKSDRPDHSDNHSFPSGHTALAFMTATMLSKEYGNKSQWVSIGAYTLATTTGIMRMGNNRHWLSDVLTGAGIGILSTEMGYWMADALFKNRGLEVPDKAVGDIRQHADKPSFLALYMGFNQPLSRLDISAHTSLGGLTSATVGVEGAWFMNRYIGFGGRATVADVQYLANEVPSSANSIKYYTLTAGPYFSLPLTSHWRVGSQLTAGGVWYPTTHIANHILSKRSGLAVGTGLNLTYQPHPHFAYSLFCDYSLLAPQSHASYMHSIAYGAKVQLML